MNHPWLLIAGASLFGLIFPGLLSLFSPSRIYGGTAVVCSIAFGLIAAAFAL